MENPNQQENPTDTLLPQEPAPAPAPAPIAAPTLAPSPAPELQTVQPVAAPAEPIPMPEPLQSTEMPYAPASPVPADMDDTLITNPSPTVADQFVMAPEKKSKKKLFIILGGVIGLLLASSVSFAAYYFAVRVPDVEYQNASTIVDSILSDISQIQSDTKNDLFKSTSIVTASATTAEPTNPTPDVNADALKKVADVKKSINSLADSVKQLQESAAIKRDSTAQKALASAQGTIDNYRSSISNTADSLDTLGNIAVTCKTWSEKLQQVKSVSEYDSISKDCIATLTQHPSVPLTDLNDKFYKPWRDVVLDMIASARKVFVAAQAGIQTDYDAALQSIQADTTTGNKLSDGITNYRANLPKDPTKELNDLKTVLQTRKAIFFR